MLKLKLKKTIYKIVFTFKKNLKVLLLLTLPFITQFSCNPAEPPDSTGQDTTSHNFSFQTWTFGDHSSSRLNDVAIINDSNIWAVGEIYMNDSLGQSDPIAYNVIHWDGNQWKLIRIKTNACGGVLYPPIKSIFMFSSSDILFGHIDGSITHYNGIEFTNDCSLIMQLNGAADKIWGLSKDNFYVVSSNGFIAHYENGTWSKIESNTDLDIYDIWGDYNNSLGEYEIIAVAAKMFVTYDKKILSIKNNLVNNLSTDSIPYSIHSIWFKSWNKCYVSGAGLFTKNNVQFTSPWVWLSPEVSNYYLYGIRGQDTNDVMVCGAFGELIHYNGSTWKSYINETRISYGALSRVDFRENIVVAVGYDSPKAVITIGKR